MDKEAGRDQIGNNRRRRLHVLLDDWAALSFFRFPLGSPSRIGFELGFQLPGGDGLPSTARSGHGMRISPRLTASCSGCDNRVPAPRCR
jgi:hypothetical protein